MSKNYEVLRKAEKDLELFRTDLIAAPRGTGRNGHPNCREQVREEILRLIQRIFPAGFPSAPRVVVFSAVEHGNGCSWVCARAGEALAAHCEGTVCLVDANLESPMLHQYFGVNCGSGLADAIMRTGPVQNFAQPIRGSRLWLLSGRALPSDESDVLSRERVKPRLDEIAAGFSHVLIDAPPVNASVDSLMFGQMADGLVLVLEANSTRREAARKAKERLLAAKVRLLGVVLNKRTYPIPQALYTRI